MALEDVFDPNNIPPDVLLLMGQYANILRRGGENGSTGVTYQFCVLVQQRGHSLQYAEQAEKAVSQPIVEQWYRQHVYR